VYVLDIYAASEPPIAGITSERLVERMRELGFDRARYAPSEEAVMSEVLRMAQPGDLIMTIGAGSITKMAETLAATMHRQGMDAKNQTLDEEVIRPISL
jgi:UDP-N-acetylmuramate--alanine ligase